MPALTSDVSLQNPLKLFGETKISEKDFRYYQELVESGKEEQAIEEFLEKYITPFVEKYQQTLQNYISQASDGQFTNEDQSSMERSVSLLVIGITAILAENFQQFSERVISPAVFTKNKIISKKD